jgi:hypothetical protein
MRLSFKAPLEDMAQSKGVARNLRAAPAFHRAVDAFNQRL